MDDMEPFFMSHSFEQLCEEIRRILDTGDVLHVDETTINAVTNEMYPNIDVLHPIVGVRIVHAYHRALVVAVENAGLDLRETKFREKGSKPNHLSCAMRTRNVFGLT
jgi:hypothetical protein